MGYGLWAVGYGLWAMGYGLWACMGMYVTDTMTDTMTDYVCSKLGCGLVQGVPQSGRGGEKFKSDLNF